jgi:hypothetical protein
MFAFQAVVGLAALCQGATGYPTQIMDAELFAALDLNFPGLEQVRSAVEQRDYTAAAVAWADYFRGREKPRPHFSRDTWAPFVREAYPQLVPPIIEAANKVAAGELSHPPFTLPA